MDRVLRLCPAKLAEWLILGRGKYVPTENGQFLEQFQETVRNNACDCKRKEMKMSQFNVKQFAESLKTEFAGMTIESLEKQLDSSMKDAAKSEHSAYERYLRDGAIALGLSRYWKFKTVVQKCEERAKSASVTRQVNSTYIRLCIGLYLLALLGFDASKLGSVNTYKGLVARFLLVESEETKGKDGFKLFSINPHHAKYITRLLDGKTEVEEEGTKRIATTSDLLSSVHEYTIVPMNDDEKKESKADERDAKNAKRTIPWRLGKVFKGNSDKVVESRLHVWLTSMSKDDKGNGQEVYKAICKVVSSLTMKTVQPTDEPTKKQQNALASK